MKHSTGMVYPINRMRIARRTTKQIVLSHIRNFCEIGTVLPPMAKEGNTIFCSQILEYYFNKDMAPKRIAKGVKNAFMPYHYLIEQVDNDFIVTTGSPEYSYSYFLDDLAYARFIPEIFRSSIVIAIKEDFSRDLAVERFWDQLGTKLIGPLLHRYDLSFKSVFYIDQVINYPKYEIEKDTLPYKYDIKKGEYFDMSSLDRVLKEHTNNLILY